MLVDYIFTINVSQTPIVCILNYFCVCQTCTDYILKYLNCLKADARVCLTDEIYHNVSILLEKF